MKVLVILTSLLGLTVAQLDLLCVGLPDNTRLPSEDSCSLFYECFDEIAYLVRCLDNEYFNPETSECDDEDNVECFDETTTIPGTSTSRPMPEVNCGTVPDFGFISSPDSCREYFQCIDGRAFLLECPRGLYFSPERLRCMNQNEANCVITTPGPPPGDGVSCENVPDSGLLPSPVSCAEYYQCFNNVPYRLQCPRGLYFSPERLRCMNQNDANCVITTPGPPPTPPSGDVNCDDVPDFGFVPSPVSCAEYYQCFNNVPYRLQCPRGLYFSPERLRCMNQNDANCVITTPGPPPTPPSGDVNCDDVPDFGFVPSPTSCSEYYQCVSDEAYRLQCPRGMHFSLDLNKCAAYSVANCTVTTPPTVTSPVTNPGPTITCDDVTNFNFVASPVSCANYYQCIDGNAFLLSCPLNQHFDESRQTCDHQDIVQCDSGPSLTLPSILSDVPSCEGVENSRFIASPVSCTEYFQCIDGNAFRVSCPRGLYFHERIQMCDTPFNVDCVTEPIESTTSAQPPFEGNCDGVGNFSFIEHPTDCALYYQCIGGQAILSSCPVSRYFDESIQTCADSELVDCGDRSRRPTTTTQAPIIDPSCINVEEGRFVPNMVSCRSYYQCIGGRAMPRFCDDDLWFDEGLQRCVDPEIANCSYENVPTVPTVPTTQTTPEPQDVCFGLDSVYVGSPVYCERFYYCVEGFGFPNICTPGQWFDRELLICRPSDEVECSFQTLPTTPGDSTTTDTSPAGLCLDARNGTYVGNIMACGEFFMCLNGEPHGRLCQEDFWFNMVQQRCTHPYDTTCHLDSIVCNGVNDGATVRAPASCSEFVTCVDGNPYPGRCFNHLFFDEETNNCLPRDVVECNLILPTVEPRGPCDGAPDFSLVGNLESCTNYFVCYDNEVFTALECPPGQNFDFARASCDEDVECLL